MAREHEILRAKVLSLVGWVDGCFHDLERAEFERVISHNANDDSEIESLLGFSDAPPDRKEVFDAIRNSPREYVVSVIKQAYSMSQADGRFHEAEILLLFDLAVVAGVPRERMREFRKMLEAHFDCEKLERSLFA